LIKNETDEHRTLNVQHRTSNECILSILKKIERHAAPALRERFHPSKFDILRFAFYHLDGVGQGKGHRAAFFLRPADSQATEPRIRFGI
jgi:hypothetical protein